MSSPKTLILLVFGWMGLLWLGMEASQSLFGGARSQAAERAALVETLLGVVDGPATEESQAEIAAAERAAREALLARPLDSGALALLGLAADARDDAAGAKALIELAARRSPADPLAQAWLFRHRLAAKDVRGSLLHADVILRAQPSLLERLLPALTAIAADPGGMPALAEHLAAEPLWRSRFLERLAAKSADPLAPFGLFSALMASSSPPTQPELRPYLLRLVDSRLYEQAHLLWIEALSADQLANVRYLFNGGFEEEPTGFLFDWALEPVAGARTEIAAVPDGDGNALRVQFLERRVAYRHVKQLIMLMPGRYRLTGRVKADDLRNARGLHWTLTCAEDAGTRLGASGRIRGTAPWQAFSVDFTVPAAGCKAQWLKLELAARIPSERHAAGIAWYDDLALARIDGPDDCPDEGPLLEVSPAIAMQSIDEASLAEAEETEEEARECTCSAPVGTPAELREVEGEILVLRGDRWFEAESEVHLIAGDRVVVTGGGRAVLVQELCRFELTAQSVVTVTQDECLLCAAVVTTREANVAYGQSGGEIGGVASGGAVGPAPATLAPLTTRTSSLPNLTLGLGGGDTRPPASQ